MTGANAPGFGPSPLSAGLAKAWCEDLARRLGAGAPAILAERLAPSSSYYLLLMLAEPGVFSGAPAAAGASAAGRSGSTASLGA